MQNFLHANSERSKSRKKRPNPSNQALHKMNLLNNRKFYAL